MSIMSEIKDYTPGYTDGNKIYFAGAGKGGKAFMSLQFDFQRPRERTRLNVPELPVRFNIVEARRDLDQYAKKQGWLLVGHVWAYCKGMKEVF